jgi:hypothetical protein
MIERLKRAAGILGVAIMLGFSLAVLAYDKRIERRNLARGFRRPRSTPPCTNHWIANRHARPAPGRVTPGTDGRNPHGWEVRLTGSVG